MKTRTMIVCGLSSFTIQCADLAVAGPAGKTYGGFSAGDKFTLKVYDAYCRKSSISGGGLVPIPSGIPKFKIGQKVKFKIGNKGQLTGPGFSVIFENSDGYSSYYRTVKQKGFSTSLMGLAHVDKSAITLSSHAVVQLYKHVGLGGLNYTVYETTYLLQK